MPRLALQRIVEKLIGRKPGTFKIALDANLPLVIKSLYTAKGEAFENRSIYRIMYSFSIDGDNAEPPKIEFKGLVFVQHLEPSIDARAYLDQLWEQVIHR